MRYVVLGGAGFLGSHLVDRLVNRGEKVVVVDNLARGSLRNIAGAMQKGVEFLHVDLSTDRVVLRPDDVVFNLAAKCASIEYNRLNQYDMLHANLTINANVIDMVRRARPALLVYMSSACVYPHDAPVPTPESAGDICNPEPTNHGYGVAKWVGEQMVKHLHKEHNVPCVIVRGFNFIGERDYYDESAHVVPALIKRVLGDENPLRVWGSGNQTRVFVDAKDGAKALDLIARRMTAQTTNFEGKWDALGEQPWVINLGHGREYSIREIAETVVQLAGTDTAIEFDTSKPDGHARRAADVTRLRDLIYWVPDTPLQDTIAAMIREYRGVRP